MGYLNFTTVEINEKLEGAFGGIHVHGNATSQSIPNGASYTKIINFSDNDPSSNVTPDAANNKLTILKDGKYRVEGSFSMAASVGNITSFGSVFLNGIEIESLHFSRKISTSGDIGNAGVSGIITLSENDEVDFRVRHDSGSNVNFTFSYMNLNLSRVDI